jgi:hypothetical protein
MKTSSGAHIPEKKSEKVYRQIKNSNSSRKSTLSFKSGQDVSTGSFDTSIKLWANLQECGEERNGPQR